MSRQQTYKMTQVSVAGFKSIREFSESLPLRDLNVLIGANGAGKSNFVAVFEFIRQLVTETLQSYVAKSGYANRVLHLGSRNTPSLSVGFTIEHPEDTLSYQVALDATVDDQLTIRTENISELKSPSEDATTNSTNGTGGQRESTLRSLADEGNTAARAIWAYCHDVICYHFLDPSAITRATGIDDCRWLYWDGRNLASFLMRLRDQSPRSYRQIVDIVRSVAPFFGDFVLEPDARNPDKLFMRWRQQGADDVFLGHQLSDGTIRFACLATLLCQPEPPKLIVVDEPELGLHPFAINVLGGLLRSASTKTQIIVSTQSVTLLDNFEPEDIIVVDHEDNQSVFRRLDSGKLADWLEDYSIGELWQKNVVGGRP